MTAPAPVFGDEMVQPVLLGLLDCLREALAASPLGEPCVVELRHSDQGPILDGCDCTSTDPVTGRTKQGHAYVRLVQVLPDPNLNRSGVNLPTGSWPGWYVQVELGVGRCWPTTDDGTPLDADTQTAQAKLHLADAAALRRAVRCCQALGEFSWDWISGGPMGPQGACAGNYATIAVRTTRDY